MKKACLIIIILLCNVFVPELMAEGTKNANNRENIVTLVTTGLARTKKRATIEALRDALSQAFGTFVSSNTTILNDELVRDEITNLTNGNIQSYRELGYVRTANGYYEVTVEAVVSVDMLVKYAIAHGSNAEFAGQTFLFNARMKELNKKNEKSALNNLLITLETLQKTPMFDYGLQINEPKQKSDGVWYLPVEVTTTTNSNYENFIRTLYHTLNSLSLNEKEVNEYERQGLQVNELRFRRSYIEKLLNQGNLNTKHFPQNYNFNLRNNRKILEQFASRLCKIINDAQQQGHIKETGGNVKCCTPVVSKFKYFIPEDDIERLEYGILGKNRDIIDIDADYRLKKQVVNQSGKFVKDNIITQVIPESSGYNFPAKIVEIPYTLEDLGKVKGFEISIE